MEACGPGNRDEVQASLVELEVGVELWEPHESPHFSLSLVLPGPIFPSLGNQEAPPGEWRGTNHSAWGRLFSEGVLDKAASFPFKKKMFSLR